MAKVGLAAELARQAAQAAREEVAARDGATPAAPARWQVPALEQDFGLDAALDTAVRQVAAHYRQVLAPEGLSVEVEPPAAVAPLPQEEPPMRAVLREKGGGRVLKAYTAPMLLGMFAAQQQALGVVVDGQV